MKKNDNDSLSKQTSEMNERRRYYICKKEEAGTLYPLNVADTLFAFLIAAAFGFLTAYFCDYTNLLESIIDYFHNNDCDLHELKTNGVIATIFALTTLIAAAFGNKKAQEAARNHKYIQKYTASLERVEEEMKQQDIPIVEEEEQEEPKFSIREFLKNIPTSISGELRPTINQAIMQKQYDSMEDISDNIDVPLPDEAAIRRTKIKRFTYNKKS